MKNWEIKSIDQLCDRIVDCVNRTAPKVEFETPYKMIRTTNVRHGRINLDDVNYVDEATFLKWTRRELPKINDIVLTREAPLGEVGIIKSNDKVFLGQRTVMYRANLHICDPYFLFYSLLSPHCQNHIKSFASGSTVEHMRVPDSKKIEIPTPPLPIQKRIASILKAYDDLIENNLKRIKLLEEIAQRTYEEWFVKFRVNGEQLSIDEATGLPSGWERKKITECYSFRQHKNKIKPFEGELKYLATADVDGTLITGEGETVNWENKPSRAQIKLIKESVWFARMSKTYKVIVTTSNFNQEFIISSGFAGFVPRNSYCLPFLFCLINSNDFDEKKNLFATGSTQVSLNDISLSSILVIEPEIGLIESFGKLFLSQLELRQNLIDQNQKLKQSRDILLPRLMNGTINVES
jgi:type I restriction enzyme S subunit